MTHDLRKPDNRPSGKLSWKLQLELAQATIAECKDSEDAADRIRLAFARRTVRELKLGRG
jgi:hypothetical protein